MEKHYTEKDLAGKEILLENHIGLTAAEAARKLESSGLSSKTVGTGDTVTGQLPAPGQMVPGGSEVLLYLDEKQNPWTVPVPDFSGMHRQQAAEAAGKQGL